MKVQYLAIKTFTVEEIIYIDLKTIMPLISFAAAESMETKISPTLLALNQIL